MIVDTSAIIAILLAEPERESMVRAITESDHSRMSAASYVECCLVVDAVGDPVLSSRLDQLLDALGVAVEPVTLEQARLARDAGRAYGRGSGHPARLNFGDCFTYALARSTGEPLLFKGDDFARTDLRPAGA